MNRRKFLHNLSHSVAVPGLMTSFGLLSPQRLAAFMKQATQTDRVLVLIYMQGGNDGLNTVIPLDQMSALNSVRPNLILPEQAILKLNVPIGLHPSLSGLRSLYNEGRLQIVQSVGYPQQNYSHFRSTDIWMSGADYNQVLSSGWAGRYLNQEYPDFPSGYPTVDMPDPLAVELGYGSSLLFQGPSANMSMVMSDPNSFYQLVSNQVDASPNTDAGKKLDYLRLTAQQSQVYGQVVKNAASLVTSQPGYDPNNNLAQQLKVVARLIAGGLRTPLYLVRVGSFDTHTNQVESDHTQGSHANLLTQVNDAIMSFMNDLNYQGVGDRVMGMTFSEFGRRIISNGSRGTDHGSALPVFLFGNKVRGGVNGNNPIISPTATVNDNLDMQFDFRQIYESILEQWFGVPAAERQNVLLKNYNTFQVVYDYATTGIPDRNETTGVHVFPNPVSENTTIEFLSAGQGVGIQVVDMQGRKVAELFNGNPPSGKFTFNWDASTLAAGYYLIVFRIGAKTVTRTIRR